MKEQFESQQWKYLLDISFFFFISLDYVLLGL